MPIGYKMAELKYQKRRTKLLLENPSTFGGCSPISGPLRNSLGLSNARICYTTGAMLSPEAFRFYHALNLPLKSLYGTTEGGALTGAKNDDIQLETVGPPHRGTEVRITDKGEIIYRQPGIFVGYYKDPEKTAEVLKDGWFYSGDSGFIREDGHIVFVDRVKDIVGLANGDRLAPQFIESRLRFSPYIKDAWVVAGPGRAYASASLSSIMIMSAGGPDKGGWLIRPSPSFPRGRRFMNWWEQEIDRVNRTLSPGSRVRKYVNLHKEFDPDEGELTRTRKLRRTFLEERYRELIDAIYTDKTEVPIEARVRHRDGRMETIKTTLSIKSVEGIDLMAFFLQLVVTGFALGMVYALVAIGFVIILKCSEAFNIAQGHFVLIGGYLGYTFLVPFGLPVWAALVLAIAVAIIMGLVNRTPHPTPTAGSTSTRCNHDDHRPGHDPGGAGNPDLGRPNIRLTMDYCQRSP